LTRPFLLIALAGGLVAFFYPASPASRTSIRLASLNALGWFLSGLLQRKGWHYHTLPAVAAASVAIWLIMLDLASTGSVRRGLWQNAMRFATVLLLVFAGARTLRVSWGYPSGNGNLVPLVAREARGRSVIGLATGMSIFPLVNDTETHLGLHYNSLWLLPGLYAQQVSGGSADGQWHYRRPAEMGGPEREMFDSVAGDLAAEPALVILWRRATQQGMGELRVDLVGYFAQDPRVRAALNRYEPISVPGDYLVLRHLPSGSTASSLVR
jgi:hypothetical protein